MILLKKGNKESPKAYWKLFYFENERSTSCIQGADSVLTCTEKEAVIEKKSMN